MAKIYLSYSHRDTAFATALVERFRANGHQMVVDLETLSPGTNWRDVLATGLRDADAFVVLLSESSMASSYTLMEVGTARAYSSEIGHPLVIPVIIDDIEIPIALQDIQVLFATDRDVHRIANEVERSLSSLAGLVAAKGQKAEEVAKKISANAATYIEEAVSAQKTNERTNSIFGFVWYLIGFVSLLGGLAFAFLSLSAHRQPSGWIAFASLMFAGLVVIGFLGACAKYAFSLGKAYTSEALKASDRMHAIAFGKFYLKAFEDKVEWSEVKEVFQYWNIDRSSTFAALDASQIDPQILSLMSRLAEIASPKGGKDG